MLRANVGLLTGLTKHYQRTPTMQPQCETCSKLKGRVEYVNRTELVDSLPGDGKPYANVLLSCHGKEQLARFDLGTVHWTWQQLARRLAGRTWFEFNEIDGVTESR